VWTPEDASRFLTSAIHEAQRPLADALKRRSVSAGVLALVVILLAAAATVVGWVLHSQLVKAEAAAEAAREAGASAINQRHELLARTEGLNAKLAAETEQLEQLRRQYRADTERLETELTANRGNEDELKRIPTEMQRNRRQNLLLRSQISGLEMEKQALARQLAAVKALAMADDEIDDEALFESAEQLEQSMPEIQPAQPQEPMSTLRPPETGLTTTDSSENDAASSYDAVSETDSYLSNTADSTESPVQDGGDLSDPATAADTPGSDWAGDTTAANGEEETE
ncbi:MAG: hypothetical protein LIP23_05880, partial [Planctomycetes bacterium]|nr:hypothetical protein [Planctomycetota bacterium]